MLQCERAGLELLPRPLVPILIGEQSVLGYQSLPLQEACLLQLERLNALELGPVDQLLVSQALHDDLCLLTDRAQFRATSLQGLGLRR
jgi:hypothetical protein